MYLHIRNWSEKQKKIITVYIGSVYQVMNSADTVEQVVLKFIEDQNLGLQKLFHCFIFRSKSCLAAGLRSDPLRELERSPDFIFGPQMHPKRLAAGLGPDPLGSFGSPPVPQPQWVWPRTSKEKQSPQVASPATGFTHKSHLSIDQAPKKNCKSKTLFKYILNRLCE